MDLIQGSGNNPGKESWVVATGKIMGEDAGPCHLAALVLASYPPQLGSGIRLAGVDVDVDVDVDSLCDLQRKASRYWTAGGYEVHGYIDSECVLHSKGIRSVGEGRR